MNYWINLFKWNFDKGLAKLTVYRLIIFTIFLWGLGVWLWIIPNYTANTKELKKENQKISNALESNHSKTNLPQKIINNEELNYDGVLTIVVQHHLKLEEFRRQATSNNTNYQIIVKGRWLNVREFLTTFIEVYLKKILIESIDFKRDQITNELTLTMLVLIKDGGNL